MAIRGRTYAVFLLLGAAGTASGFQTPAFLPALARAAGWPQLRRLAAASAGRRAGRPAPAARAQCSVEQWCEAADQNGLHARANALPAEDVRALLEAAMSGEPKRRDTFAEVGGGRGEAMAAALTLYPEIGQTALFLPEDQQEAAQGTFAAAKNINRVFEPCQIILGDVLDLSGGSRMLTYFDIVFADTRGAEWGSAVDGPATTLSAACGQSCLEGSRVITVGRPLVEEEGVWAFDLLHTLELSCGAAGLVWEVARSAKSTPPDSTQNAEAGYQVGSWVQLVGLKTQPILNGSQAVILEVHEDNVLTVLIDDLCQTIKVRSKNTLPISVVDP